MKILFSKKSGERISFALLVFLSAFFACVFSYAENESTSSDASKNKTAADEEKKPKEDSSKARYNDFLYQYDKEITGNQELGQDQKSNQPPPTYSDWKSKQTSEKVQAKEYNRNTEKIRAGREKAGNKLGK